VPAAPLRRRAAVAGRDHRRLHESRGDALLALAASAAAADRQRRRSTDGGTNGTHGHDRRRTSTEAEDHLEEKSGERRESARSLSTTRLRGLTLWKSVGFFTISCRRWTVKVFANEMYKQNNIENNLKLNKKDKP
jgi:hypothetical protein